MSKKDEALKLAQDLRALADRFSEGWHDGIKIDASDIVLLSDAAEALAEQPPCKYPHCPYPCPDLPDCRDAEKPAQQDSETITQNFTGLPKRKLRDLLSAGWQINGVCFQRTEEDGTVRRGAATTGGMVLWWNTEQTAQQREPQQDSGLTNRYTASTVAKLDSRKPEQLAQRKPLTFSKLCDIEYEITHRDGDFSILKFARAIEAAHGITGEEEALAEQPAQRTWVGLTDEERDAILNREFKQWWSRHDAVCRAIEAKLREKNQ